MQRTNAVEASVERLASLAVTAGATVALHAAHAAQADSHAQSQDAAHELADADAGGGSWVGGRASWEGADAAGSAVGARGAEEESPMHRAYSPFEAATPGTESSAGA